jgi:hypothetical protein
VWLVGGDRASCLVGEDGVLAGAAGAHAVVVQELVVVAAAEQDEVVEFRRPAELERDDVVCFELTLGGAPGVLAVPV